jgi:hypothetical protein
VKQPAYSNKYPSLSITYVFIFCIGLACMGVAGYFLIEGLSQFAGGGTAKNMLIVGGVLFQITESVCFIAASALTYHSLRWRYILFSLGSVLFLFSIGVMTLAQKTALQTGEAQAQAIDEKRDHLRSQIASLQQVIDSYRLNAEKQSKSIYKDSRALGQDSINRAAELEERKMQLSEELFKYNSLRRQTSSDFFYRLQEVTGLPQKSTEFYFLVVRSLLLEMSGIILMSFGANLRAYRRLVENSTAQSGVVMNEPLLKKIFYRFGEKAGNPAVMEPDSAPRIGTSVLDNRTANETNVAFDNNSDAKGEQEEAAAYKEQGSTVVKGSGHQLTYLATMVVDLYEQRLLRELNPVAIMEGLSRYCSQKVSYETAGVLSKMINKRLDESC